MDSSSVLTEQQLLDLRSDRLTRTAQEMGLAHPPTVELVRWVDPTDMAPTRVACLADQGFAATADGGSGITYGEVPPSQEEAFKAAVYTCEAKYSLHPYYELPKSAAALSKAYQWYTEVSTPCLKAEGYDISEPPSKEAWLAVATNGGAYWSPWSEVPIRALSPAQRQELERRCPQGPEPSEFLEHVPVLQR